MVCRDLQGATGLGAPCSRSSGQGLAAGTIPPSWEGAGQLGGPWAALSSGTSLVGAIRAC